jgi:hypothetical protein
MAALSHELKYSRTPCTLRYQFLGRLDAYLNLFDQICNPA